MMKSEKAALEGTTPKTAAPKKLLRLRDVCARVGLSRSEIYRRLKNQAFPQAIPIGTRVKAFSEEEIDAWVIEQIAKRDAGRRDG